MPHDAVLAMAAGSTGALFNLIGEMFGSPGMSAFRLKMTAVKWLLLGSTVGLVVLLVPVEFTAIYMAFLAIPSAAVNHWLWPWLDAKRVREIAAPFLDGRDA